jgi:L-threonylcarbamoyladenylate synthase
MELVQNYDEIIKLIASGAVGVLPTDTVYGLVCSVRLPDSVQRLYDLKHREHKPGTIIAANIDQLIELGLKRRYLMPLANYWPGAVSVVIPCGEELEYLHQGIGSLAVRIPDVERLQKLLEQTGPLLTSSANLPGEPTAVTVDQARQCFDGRADFYIDGGDLSGRAPSTIVRVVDDAIEVLRQGAVTIAE